MGRFGRYVQIVEGDERHGGKDGRLAIVGVELVFLDARDGQRAEPSDRDRDDLVDSRDKCPDDPETYNGLNDHDGCPDDDQSFFVKDRFVIDERVFFDYDKTELRPGGKEKLDHIAQLCSTEKSWISLKVQGHTDSRGTEKYNEELSRKRAASVREYLVSKGVPASMLNVEAYGERYPAIPDAVSESEHQRNRRVEFVMTRKAP